MKNILLFAFCLFLFFSFSACEKPPVEPVNPEPTEIEYTISPASLNFDAVGGEAGFTVFVKPPATVESVEALDTTWCQVFTNSPKDVIVKIAPNTDIARNSSVVVKMKSGEIEASATVSINQESADFVLINGLRWATRNVDAPGKFAAHPEDAGMFYQWNRKVGWSATDPITSSDGNNTWNMYPAAGNTWEKTNDPCPPGWRVPTQSELGSLANVGSRWTTLNGVEGRLFGSDEPLLFLPAVGYREEHSQLCIEISMFGGRIGYYWSSSSSTIGSYDASSLFFSKNRCYNYPRRRSSGHSVRCVAE